MPIYVRGEHAILHVHIPKTGGDSLRHLLLTNGFTCLPATYTTIAQLPDDPLPCSRQHFDRELILEHFPRNWSLSLAVTRHPFDRFLSEYRYRVTNPAGSLGWLRKREPLSFWSRRALRARARNPYLLDNHLRPQVDFLLPDLDLVWKVENGLAGCVEWLLERGVDLRADLPRRNITSEGKRAAMPGWLVRELAQAYAEDFEQLGYSAHDAPEASARV